MSSTFQCSFGQEPLVIETGRLAKQANGSLLITHGESVALVTATMSNPREGIDFFPLTIDFEERMYARGKIPGSFFRREGRPSTDAVLIDRLTDRPLRPLFPKGFRNEVQIIITPFSSDQEHPFDVLAIIGASAALTISDIPFSGPLSATRVGYVDGDFVISPTYQQLDESRLDLVVAGTRDGVLMMEVGADELPESIVEEAIRLGQNVNLEVIALQEDMARQLGKAKAEFPSAEVPADLSAAISSLLDGRVAGAFDSDLGKAGQATLLDSLKGEAVEGLKESYEAPQIYDAFEELLEKEFKVAVLDRGIRPDGRGLGDIRELDCEVGLLPRTHGSGLFQRGETQVLGITTLGSVGDAQRIDTLNPKDTKPFLLHYNFPPYSVGETKRVGSPGRREIGHGTLAERAITPVLPSQNDFPYVIRVVAEVLGSNGSTSMGSTCACILALMDAGVPIKKPVAGISIGLVEGENGRFATLTDIQGMEDHLGDMDFKVAGTTDGITAIQLDIKVSSIGFDVVEATLEQAREARLTILERMSQTISAPRTEMSPYAPRMTRITVPVDKIGAVIGPGGKTIRGIVEETGATVDVEDDGTVTIGSSDESAARRAVEMIERLTKVPKVGEIYTGKVVRILNFGAFVEILPGTDGMVHISELADYHVPTVEDVLSLGEEVTVMIKDVGPDGKISLSRRALLTGSDDGGERESGRDEERERPLVTSGPPGGGGGGRRDDRPRGVPGRGGPPRSGGRGPGGGGRGGGGGYRPRPPGGGGPPR